MFIIKYYIYIYKIIFKTNILIQFLYFETVQLKSYSWFIFNISSKSYPKHLPFQNTGYYSSPRNAGLAAGDEREGGGATHDSGPQIKCRFSPLTLGDATMRGEWLEETKRNVSLIAVDRCNWSSSLNPIGDGLTASCQINLIAYLGSIFPPFFSGKACDGRLSSHHETSTY